MWIVAIGWAYVVILMAATETSVIAGIMTFFGYGVLPMSILFYLAGAGRRRRRRADASAQPPKGPSSEDTSLPLVTISPFALADAGNASVDCGSGSDGGCGGGD